MDKRTHAFNVVTPSAVTDLNEFQSPRTYLEALGDFPREDAGGLSREYVLRIPSVS